MRLHIDLKARLLHSSLFCFCIPVRAGFVLITILSFLLSGTISVIIWFEIFSSYQLSPNERVVFIVTGVVESLLFLASTIGFIGVVARKQLFVMICTYFLYVHFVINVVVGIYFLVTVRASNRQQLVDYCAQVLVNTSIESSCSRLMSVSTYVFIAIVAALLLLEFYAVLIATRYVYRLRMQKRDDRSRRLGYFHALSTPETLSSGHTRRASDDIELLHSASDPQGTEDVVLDIQPQNYIPVSTHDRDLPPAPALVSPLHSSSDMASGRRVRALPPRPNTGSSAVTRASNRPKKDAALPERLPNPHEPLSNSSRGRGERPQDSEDDHHGLYTAEVSTTAHSALMDHATYMEPVFVRPNLSLR